MKADKPRISRAGMEYRAPAFKRAGWILLAAAIGIGLTCASFAYQRMGPEIGIYGNTCESQPQGLCTGRLLGAGFPLEYVVDEPGVSVMYKLEAEDQVRVLPFVLDAAFYGVIIYAGGIFMALSQSEAKG